MIIKGASRSGPLGLAAHLGNAEKNERVTLLETRGTVAQDLKGALVEMDALALGTRCTKPLYHAALSPAMPHRLTPEQREEAIDALEEKLGLTGQPRVVVMHEKYGREHIHVVWSRIDLDKMGAVPDSHNYRKHEEVARDLERRFGHERVQGAHVGREGVTRPPRTPSRAELRQEERTGIKGKDVRAEITELFRSSDNADAFKASLTDKGYILAKGDRRDFVIVDRAGGIHSLARRIEGVKAAQLREFMSGISRDDAKSLAENQAVIDERRRLTSEAMATATREKGYSGGSDYVSQSTAALTDHQKRQDALDKKIDKEISNRIDRMFGEPSSGRDSSGDGSETQIDAAQSEFKRRSERIQKELHPFAPSEHELPTAQRDFRREGEKTTLDHRGDGFPQESDMVADASFGDQTSLANSNDRAKARYQKILEFLYGSANLQESEQRKQAEEKAFQEGKDREERVKLEFMSDKPKGFEDSRTTDAERAHARYLRIERQLRDENWQGHEDLEPDRQQGAPAGGHSRSR